MFVKSYKKAQTSSFLYSSLSKNQLFWAGGKGQLMHNFTFCKQGSMGLPGHAG
jgi:hypothetical protein